MSLKGRWYYILAEANRGHLRRGLLFLLCSMHLGLPETGVLMGLAGVILGRKGIEMISEVTDWTRQDVLLSDFPGGLDSNS